MFKNILVPVSSEFYSKKVMERSAFFADKFNSEPDFVYIIEEKALDKADQLSHAVRTPPVREETKQDIIQEHQRTADDIVFDDADLFLKKKRVPFTEKVVEGEFSDVIHEEMQKKKYDLILMGVDKDSILNYRILDESDVPIWVESDGDNKKILAVCSNLAPNQKVPRMSKQLADTLGWELQMLYVVDTRDKAEVTPSGERQERQPTRSLVERGEDFLEDFEDECQQVSLTKGSLEREVVKAVGRYQPGLMVIGREHKKKKLLGLLRGSVKKKIAGRSKSSVLFVS